MDSCPSLNWSIHPAEISGCLDGKPLAPAILLKSANRWGNSALLQFGALIMSHSFNVPIASASDVEFKWTYEMPLWSFGVFTKVLQKQCWGGQHKRKSCLYKPWHAWVAERHWSLKNSQSGTHNDGLFRDMIKCVSSSMHLCVKNVYCQMSIQNVLKSQPPQWLVDEKIHASRFYVFKNSYFRLG